MKTYGTAVGSQEPSLVKEAQSFRQSLGPGSSSMAKYLSHSALIQMAVTCPASTSFTQSPPYGLANTTSGFYTKPSCIHW